MKSFSLSNLLRNKKIILIKSLDPVYTWLRGCVQILLEERHGVDLLQGFGRIKKLHSCEFTWAAAQLIETRCEVEPAWIWRSEGEETLPHKQPLRKKNYSCSQSNGLRSGRSTLQHAVVCLPVLPTKGFPESRRLRPLIAFLNGDFAAAVETCLQRTTVARHGWWRMIQLLTFFRF